MVFRKKESIRPAYQSKPDHDLYGYVDELSFAGAQGWLTHGSGNGEQLGVSAYVADIHIGSAICNIYRKDISELFGFEAYAGFELSWDIEELREAVTGFENGNKNCEVEIRAQNGIAIDCRTQTFDFDALQAWLAAIPMVTAYEKNTSAKELAEYFQSIDDQIVEPKISAGDVKIIAYYLPQFHPIPENDEWWGPGFTEWTNVAQGSPYFEEHYQPHVPGELGYYDLRLPEVREAQARLAREHGIYGFCYYYYWFSGRRLLERPLEEVLHSGKPDFPFCICWANENWTRRWDGAEHDILLQQTHNEATDEAFIRDVMPLFKDKRYIRLDGAPLLLVYRLSLLPSPQKTAATWRKICAENGIPNIHLCMVESFGLTMPYDYGFDSSVQFPPHGITAGLKNSEIKKLSPAFSGNIYSMEDVIGNEIIKDNPVYKRFPGVMTAWDNTPRKKSEGNVFIDSSPENYEMWLRHAIRVARSTLPSEERCVFVNAWNEWAEGAHLEPDRKYGRAYLEATLRAFIGKSDWKLLTKEAAQSDALTDLQKNALLHELTQQVKYFQQVNAYLMHFMGEHGLPKHWTFAKPGYPICMEGFPEIHEGILTIDQINHFHDVGKIHILPVNKVQKIYIKGWNIFPGEALTANTVTYFILRNNRNTAVQYQIVLAGRHEREDVVERFYKFPDKVTRYSGFILAADISNMLSGVYTLHSIHRVQNRILRADAEVEIEIS